MQKIIGSALFILLSTQSQAQEFSQKLLVSGVYVKAIPAPSSVVPCLEFQDFVLRADDVPTVRIDSEGPFVDFDLPLVLLKSPCPTLQDALARNLFQDLQSPGDGRLPSVRVRARPPFSEIVLSDSSRILVETPIRELEDKRFLSILENSVIRGALGANINTPVQGPIFWAQFETPFPLWSKAVLSVTMGQDFIDLVGSKIHQSLLDIQLAFPVYGPPLGDSSHARVHVLYEGRHIDDQQIPPVYILGATRLSGVGGLFRYAASPKIHLQLGGDYLLSKSSAFLIQKFRWHSGLAWRLSDRWALEANYRASSLKSTSDISTLNSSRTDHALYLGFRLKPFTDKWKSESTGADQK